MDRGGIEEDFYRDAVLTNSEERRTDLTGTARDQNDYSRFGKRNLISFPLHALVNDEFR